MKKLSNWEKIELILNDLEKWMDGNDHDGGLEYAFNNGYHLHAANLWLSSGAMSNELYNQIEGVVIDRDSEMNEINELCNEAHIYECGHCNHVAFYEFDEGLSIQCMSCLKEAKKQIKEAV